jgi:FkbM family methyltransferase
VAREFEHARLNSGLIPPEFRLRRDIRFRIVPEARESFEWFCFRSLDMVTELDAFLQARAGCNRLLDVGACHGLFSLAFVAGRPGARALAVEPSSSAREVLEGNLRLNPEVQVECSTLALGATAGSLRMRREWHHLEAVPEDFAGESLEVVTETLDQLCQRTSFAPDLIKIDVEGFEARVIAGASATLSSCRPQLALEIHPGQLQVLGESVAAVVEPLLQAGYRFFWFSGREAAARELLEQPVVFRIQARPA